MRLFIALDCPPALKAQVGEVVATLRAAAPSLAWIDPAKMHLTMKFIGEAPDNAVVPLAAAIDSAAGRSHPLSIGTTGAGSFPGWKRPRVVWLGLEPDPKLELLHHDIETGCEALGYPLGGRAFRPHLTLARVRDHAPASELAALRQAARTVRVRARMEADALMLMQSTSGPGGSRYTVLHLAPLGRR